MTRTPYAISAYWPGRRWWLGHRFVLIRQMTHEQALRLGTWLYRIRWLGFNHVQIEEGAFPSSAIKTQGEPVKREADVLCLTFTDEEKARIAANDYGSDRQPIWGTKEDTERSTPPRYTHIPKWGKARLIEGTRTNYALYSEGKP